MPRWEYQYVMLESDSMLNPRVRQVNDQKQRKPYVWEFLADAGREGWEVVGMASSDPGMHQRWHIILKRPLL